MISNPGRQRLRTYPADHAALVERWRALAITRTLATWLPLALLAVLSSLAYAPYLGDYFVGGDTWAHIWTSRDVGQVLTQPIMAGSGFPETVAHFYRPISSLSYTIQYAISGLNAFAFHVGDLLIHVVAMLSLAGLAIALGVRPWAAALGAAVVSLHPVMASVVPAAPRRHDSLVTIGVCVGLALVVRYVRSPRQRALVLVGSTAALAFAELSKELGYVGLLLVLPACLLACLAGPSRARVEGAEQGAAAAASSLSPRARWRAIASVVVAWTAASAVLFVWHAHVVGGLGGYGPLSPWRDVDVRVDELVTILFWPFRDYLQGYLKAWLIEAGVLLFAVGLPMLLIQRRAAATLALGWTWLIGSSAFQLASESTAPWQTYVTVAAFGLMIAAVLDGAYVVFFSEGSPTAAGWLAGRLRHFAASWRARGRAPSAAASRAQGPMRSAESGTSTAALAAAFSRPKVAGALARGILTLCVAGVVVFAAGVVHDSVLVTQYPEWHAAGSVAQSYLAAIRACVEAAPPGESVLLEDWPVNVDDATDQFRLIVAGVFAPYSVGPAVYLTMNHPGLVVQAQKSELSVGPNRRISATCQQQGGAWLVQATYDPPLR